MAIPSPTIRYSINSFTGDGVTVQRDISFAGGFIDRTHVKAVVTDPVGNNTEVAIQWVTDSTIIINPAVPSGHTLTVYRETPKSAPLADFQDGAVISEANLDTNAKQAVFMAAEAMDRGEGALSEFAPRAVLVPVGEVAPQLPPRSTLLGKLLGIGIDGQIVPVNPLTGGSGSIDTSMIDHAGQSLAGYIAELEAETALTAAEIAAQAAAITLQGNQIIEQALSTTSLDTRLTTLRTEHDALVATVDALETLSDTTGIATMITTEAATRQTADSAMAAEIALIGAKTPDGLAFMLNLGTVKVGAAETLADRLSWITTRTDTVEVQISDEETARIAGDAGEATARAALASTLRGETAAAVAAEAAARTTADLAEATARTDLAATLRGETTAAVNTEATARAAGDAAEATARSNLATTLRGETAAYIANEQAARIAGDTAEATARTALGTSLSSSIAAQVSTEATARAAGDSALSGTIALIGAAANGGAAFQLDMNKVLVDGGASFATRISGINTSFANQTAALNSEIAARANADSALTTSFNSLSATVGGYGTSITNLQSVQANHTGYLTTLQAKWTVTLNVNGHISGINSVNNGTQSTFTVVADTFRVAQTNGSITVPFEVVGGITYIKTAMIRDASITNAHIVNLSVDSLKLANGAATQPKIQDGAVSGGGGGVTSATGYYGFGITTYHYPVSYTFTLTAPAQVIFIYSISQGYLSGTPAWSGAIELDGVDIATRGGTAKNDAPSMSAYAATVAAGTHTVRGKWAGGSSSIVCNPGTNLAVIVLMK